MTTVKRRALLTAGLGAALASPAFASPALAAPAVATAQGGPEVQWRLSSAFPKNLDILFGASEALARIVGEASEGRFAIQVLGPGEPVPARTSRRSPGAPSV